MALTPGPSPACGRGESFRLRKDGVREEIAATLGFTRSLAQRVKELV